MGYLNHGEVILILILLGFLALWIIWRIMNWIATPEYIRHPPPPDRPKFCTYCGSEMEYVTLVAHQPRYDPQTGAEQWGEHAAWVCGRGVTFITDHARMGRHNHDGWDTEEWWEPLTG